MTSKPSASDPCSNNLSELDAFLYGLPGGLLLAGLLLLCFVMFGNAITSQPTRKAQVSASSNTRLDRRNALGKKNRRGPQPSSNLRPVDVHQMALREDAPDDIRAVALASKLSKK